MMLQIRDGAARLGWATAAAAISGTNPAWTGMRSDHTTLPPSESCDGWTSDDPSRMGFAGNSGRRDGQFLQQFDFTCDREWRVYCAEQP